MTDDEHDATPTTEEFAAITRGLALWLFKETDNMVTAKEQPPRILSEEELYDLVDCRGGFFDDPETKRSLIHMAREYLRLTTPQPATYINHDAKRRCQICGTETLSFVVGSVTGITCFPCLSRQNET